jgi:hypothetical protein
MRKYKVGGYFKYTDNDYYLIGKILKIKETSCEIIVIDTNNSAWLSFDWFDFGSHMDRDLIILTKDEAMVESL